MIVSSLESSHTPLIATFAFKKLSSLTLVFFYFVLNFQGNLKDMFNLRQKFSAGLSAEKRARSPRINFYC